MLCTGVIVDFTFFGFGAYISCGPHVVDADPPYFHLALAPIHKKSRNKIKISL